MYKFELGLNYVHCTLSEMKDIVDKFHNNISTIYYSSMENEKYYARNLFTDNQRMNFNRVSIDDQLNLLKYIRDNYDIKMNLVANTLKVNDHNDVFLMVKREVDRFRPDIVTTFSDVAKMMRDDTTFSNIFISRSYNDFITSKDDLLSSLHLFDKIIIGNRWIRQPDIYKTIINYGVEPILMSNNSCSFNCKWCNSGTCYTTVKNNVQMYGINESFAISTMFPYEVDLIADLFNLSTIKLSTRDLNYKEICRLLHLMIHKSQVMMSDLHCLSPLYHWSTYYTEIDLGKVNLLKLLLMEKFIQDVEP